MLENPFEGSFAVSVSIIVLELADQQIEQGGGAGMGIDIGDLGLTLGTCGGVSGIEGYQAVCQTEKSKYVDPLFQHRSVVQR
jgi:hypothetical protein